MCLPVCKEARIKLKFCLLPCFRSYNITQSQKCNTIACVDNVDKINFKITLWNLGPKEIVSFLKYAPDRNLKCAPRD